MKYVCRIWKVKTQALMKRSKNRSKLMYYFTKNESNNLSLNLDYVAHAKRINGVFVYNKDEQYDLFQYGNGD